MQKKRNFKERKFGDLSGGINTLNYPTEIENKQFVSLENWNFKGNNLVSEKGITDTGLPTVLEVGGFKVDSGDFYQTSGTTLYKNGAEETSKYGARVKVSGITKLYKKEITDNNGDVITYQDDVFEYFPDGVRYYVNVDGTDYGVFGQTRNEIYDNLKEELETAGYTISIASEYLYVTSDSPITVTTPSYSTYVIYLKNVITSTYTWTDGWTKGFYYNINGTKGYYVDTATINDFGSDIGYDNHIRDELYNVLDGISGVDVSKANLSPSFSEDGTGTIYGKEDVTGYAAIILQKATTVEFSPHFLTQEGGGNSSTAIEIENLSSFFSDTDGIITLRNGLANELVIQPSSLGLGGVGDLVSYLQANGYPNTFSVYGKYTGDGTNPPSTTAVFPLTADYRSAAPIRDNLFSSGVVDITRWYGLSEDAFNIDSNTFENTPVISSLPNLGRTNIVIGDLGKLIINKDDAGAYYFTDNVLHTIDPNAVGEPTVGTIYQGKVILGGFEGNDNIVFSQTSTPNQPLNVLNFSSYSAGGQSVSGGDKGAITGMSVGENGLYVFKDNSIWYSNSDYDTGATYNYRFNKITSNGALSQNVITEVQQDTFYLDWKTRNVRRLSYEKNLTTLRDTSISDEVDKAFNDLPDDQPLATSSFSYPNYTLSLTDGTAGNITYPNGKTYPLNNKHFIYNVENKSWTTRTGLTDIVLSEGDYSYRGDGKTYKTFSGNIPLADGNGQHKANTFLADWDFKKLGRQSVAGKISAPAGQTKTFELGVVIDGVEEAVITVTATGEEKHFEERIPLYEKGKQISVNLRHSGIGDVEVAGLSYYISLDRSATF